ncbi:hypothetical protein EYF80_058555 [Liparis tanakae]|uniref:Uncharacterized protein n=1 Tax=Liparis tanakae TaxID=230148 RepID=A0A4Z2ESN7_9TELE|nr:hypothetical protein EYF80_058555 [Liparis tanakae]
MPPNRMQLATEQHADSVRLRGRTRRFLGLSPPAGPNEKVSRAQSGCGAEREGFSGSVRLRGRTRRFLGLSPPAGPNEKVSRAQSYLVEVTAAAPLFLH